MADCANTGGKYLGSRVLVEVDLTKCSDTYPLEAEWRKIGALSSRDIDFNADTVESITDVQAGFKETYATFQNAAFSFAGEQKESYIDNEALLDMVIFRANKLAAQKQPSMWLRVTTPALTYTFWVNLIGYSEANPEDALSTFTLTMNATGSILPPKVELTPQP